MKTILLLIISLSVLTWHGMSQSAETLFGSAQHQEEVEGNLEKAIQTYQQVVAKAGGNRALAANAQLRIGMAYEKLGRVEAAKAYQSVVRDFADQADAASQARTRLAALAPAATGVAPVSTRKLWEQPLIGGTVSPDGRFITTTDWTDGGDLSIHDLVTGVDRRLTARDDNTGSYVDHSVISPDGKRVAYMWAKIPPDRQKWEFQARMVATEGQSTPDVVYSSPQFLFVHAWTPDGKGLVVSRAQDQGAWQIAILSLADRSLRELKTFPRGQVRVSISPDGSYLAYEGAAAGSPARDIYLLATDGSSEHVAVEHPANDLSTIWSPDGTRLLFMSDRTGSPALWSIPVRDGRPIGDPELVKADMGMAQLNSITKAGALYYTVPGRSYRSIYRVPLDASGKAAGQPAEATGQFVNSNWGGTLSPDGRELAFFSLRPRQQLVIRNVASGQERTFPVDYGLLRGSYYDGPQWFPDGESVLVLVQPNSGSGKAVYRVDATTGKAERLPLENAAHQSLFRVSADGQTVFYKGNGSAYLASFDLETKQERVLFRADRTKEHVADLTVSPDGKQVAFRLQRDESQIFYVIPSSGGEPREVHRYPTQGVGGGERYNTLTWTPDQKHLLFVKNKDAASDADCDYSKKRSCRATVWRVDVASGNAENVGGDIRRDIKSPQIAPDGKSLYFSGLGVDDELWVLESFLPKIQAGR
jgi:Tol biopolymer transport system component